jgi:hypothetical protein
MKVDAVCPDTGALFRYHWKEGVLPPLTGTALKVMAPPLQAEVEDAVTATDGVMDGFTTTSISARKLVQPAMVWLTK